MYNLNNVHKKVSWQNLPDSTGQHLKKYIPNFVIAKWLVIRVRSLHHLFPFKLSNTHSYIHLQTLLCFTRHIKNERQSYLYRNRAWEDIRSIFIPDMNYKTKLFHSETVQQAHNVPSHRRFASLQHKQLG